MKKILWNLMFLFVLLACTPASKNANEPDHDEQDEYMLDDEMLEEKEKIKDDSLKDRDMLAYFIG